MNLIFDFDGTLADSSLGIYEAFKYSCKKNNLDYPDLGSFKKIIGPPINKLIHKVFPNMEPIKKEKFISNFRKSYDNDFYKKFEWYKGVPETLTFLRESNENRLYIITNKPTSICIKILKESKLYQLFDTVIGVDYLSYIGSKQAKKFSEKSLAINYLISQKSLNKKQCIYIGDTIEDKVSSEKSGIQFIPALYGFYEWNISDSSNFKLKTISNLINHNIFS